MFTAVFVGPGRVSGIVNAQWIFVEWMNEWMSYGLNNNPHQGEKQGPDRVGGLAKVKLFSISQAWTLFYIYNLFIFIFF